MRCSDVAHPSTGGLFEADESDVEEWFNRCNFGRNPVRDSIVIDDDPPFFQTRSLNENGPSRLLPYRKGLASFPIGPPSTSTDYRSVIDDLSIEIRRLKNELQRFKETRPDRLHKEKAFEIQFYDLSQTKRRELETILEDFAASLRVKADNSTWQHQVANRRAIDDHNCSEMESLPPQSPVPKTTHPGRSALGYGTASCVNCLHSSHAQSELSGRTELRQQHADTYMRGVPRRLHLHRGAPTDQAESIHVVRRLEDVFTGAIRGLSEWTELYTAVDENKFRYCGTRRNCQPGREGFQGEIQAIPEPHSIADESRHCRGRWSWSADSDGPGLLAIKSCGNARYLDTHTAEVPKRFHYQPLVFRRNTPVAMSRSDEAGSVVMDHMFDSPSGQGSCEASNRERRARDGLITYYSGLKFFTDLSGDSDRSSAEQNGLSGQSRHLSKYTRSASDSSAQSPCYTSLFGGSVPSFSVASGEVLARPIGPGVDVGNAGEISLDAFWSDKRQELKRTRLEPCGIGGVAAEDHFTVISTTKRQKTEALLPSTCAAGVSANDNRNSIARLDPPAVRIEYVSERVEYLAAISPPPPACFFSQASTSDSSGQTDDEASSFYELKTY